MNWQALQAVGELVAASGVIVSLVYLAVQVRQNTRSNEAAANQDLLANYVTLLSFSWQSPSGAHLFAHTLQGSWAELSSEEQAAGRQFWVSALRLFEHAYLQHQAGLLPREVWRGWEHQILLTAATQGFGSTWPGVRTMLSPAFVAWVDDSAEAATSAAVAYRDAFAAGGIEIKSLRDGVPPSPA
jgi:hypothetical protein